MKTTRARPNVRNQRVSNTRQRRQQHLLDVKVRSRTATQHRNRRVLVVTSKIVLLIAGIAGLYVGGRYAARQLFFENAEYRLEQISFQTDGTLQREQVLKAANLTEGVNIFSVNLAQVHAQIEVLPQVQEVAVTRKLPNQISLRIGERRPVAWITSDKELTDPFTSENAYLVDARGMLMKQKKLLPEYLGLPLISSVTSESLEPGKGLQSVEAKAALELLRLSTGSFMQTRFQIREIDLAKGYCLVVTDRNGTRVSFGFDELQRQIQRLEQLLVHSDDNRQELATVNLLVQRNIPVTYTQTPVEIINATIDPNDPGTGGPRIMRAIPVHPEDALKISAAPSSTPLPVRKAVRVKKQRKGR